MTCIFQKRLVAGQLPLRLREHVLERPRIKFTKQLPRLHDLAFGIQDFVELAIDAGVDGDGIQRSDGAQTIEIDIKISLACLGGHDRNRPAAPLSALSAGCVCAGGHRYACVEKPWQDQCRQSSDDDNPDNQPNPPVTGFWLAILQGVAVDARSPSGAVSVRSIDL